MERNLYKNLLEWKKNKSNMPYMLVGVRQTGKTHLLTEFCKKEFKNYIYINLESMENIREIFENTRNKKKYRINIKHRYKYRKYNYIFG